MTKQVTPMRSPERPTGRSIAQLVDAAGGRDKISEATVGTDHEIGPDAVRKWLNKGIPHWHWPVVMMLARATESEILAANQALATKPARAGGGPSRGSPRKSRAKRRVVFEAMA